MSTSPIGVASRSVVHDSRSWAVDRRGAVAHRVLSLAGADCAALAPRPPTAVTPHWATSSTVILASAISVVQYLLRSRAQQ